MLDDTLSEVRNRGMKVVLRIIYSEPDGSVNPCATSQPRFKCEVEVGLTATISAAVTLCVTRGLPAIGVGLPR